MLPFDAMTELFKMIKKSWWVCDWLLLKLCIAVTKAALSFAFGYLLKCRRIYELAEHLEKFLNFMQA